jgi:WD40 repeat protein
VRQEILLWQPGGPGYPRGAEVVGGVGAAPFLLQPLGAKVVGGAYSALGTVHDLAFDRDATCLAAGCDEGFVVWSIPGSLRMLVRSGSVHSVAVHPSGRLLAAAGRQIELWSCDSGKPVASLEAPAPGAKVEFSADGQWLLGIVDGQVVRGWPVGDTPEKRRLFAHHGGVPSLAFSPDGRLLASASKDRTIKVWDVPTGRLLHNCTGHYSPIEAVAFSPDGRLLASGDVGGDVRLWDPASGAARGRLERGGAPPPAPGPRTDGPFLRLQAPSDAIRGNGPPGQVWRMQFDPAGRFLVAGGLQGVVAWPLRPATPGEKIQPTLVVRDLPVFDLAVHPSGSSLALVARDPDGVGRLYRCELDQDAPQRLGLSVRMSLRTLCFDPSGRQLLYATAGDTLGACDWEAQSAAPATGPQVYHAALAPGGRWVALAVPDHGAVIYDLQERRTVLSLPPEESDVWSLAWGQDGTRLALGLADGGVAVWDLERVRARLAELKIIVPSTRPAARTNRPN